MANSSITINLTLPSESVVTGKQVTFKAPCDSNSVTGVKINDSLYSIVDSFGNPISSYAFSEGSIVSIILDNEARKAIIQNPNTTKYIEDKLLELLSKFNSLSEKVNTKVLEVSERAFIKGSVLFRNVWTINDIESYDSYADAGVIEYSDNERDYINLNLGYLEITDEIQFNENGNGIVFHRVYEVIDSETSKTYSVRPVIHSIGFASTSMPTLPISSGGTGATTPQGALNRLGVIFSSSTRSIGYDPNVAYSDGNGEQKITFPTPYKSGTTPYVGVSIVGDKDPFSHALIITEVTNTYFKVKYYHKLSSSSTVKFTWTAIGTNNSY